ncbi:TadE/TadG family type IV pilus assembly protein [Bythopirellula polymerisocia]|uniref:TadE-like protein n=1 Tax=Bythopirellula polymerisocia TaxID=2528003 RepID=A0A5C6CF11_9BACT|nr:TadE family protein [Bythopirellula polymerisocia]TWU22692.1 TadE-like protein [Bythopirellula polymerisocia]
MRKRRRYNEQAKSRLGATVVEFAICCPVLFLFTFAALEFSRVNMIRQTVENSVYEGCRRGIVPGATAANVEAAARFVLDATLISGAQVTVTPSVITEDTTNVSVSVVVPTNANSWVAPFFFTDTQISSDLTMRRERGLSSNID